GLRLATWKLEPLGRRVVGNNGLDTGALLGHRRIVLLGPVVKLLCGVGIDGEILDELVAAPVFAVVPDRPEFDVEGGQGAAAADAEPAEQHLAGIAPAADARQRLHRLIMLEPREAAGARRLEPEGPARLPRP